MNIVSVDFYVYIYELLCYSNKTKFTKLQANSKSVIWYLNIITLSVDKLVQKIPFISP